MKKDVNKAKSLYSISPQASLYVPIVDIPSRLPSYINVDRHSQWQTTALISAALETITLPSRLRPYHDFEASLAGDDGRHTIYELQCSINPQDRDDKSSTEEEGRPKAQSEFDIDFSYGDGTFVNFDCTILKQCFKGMPSCLVCDPCLSSFVNRANQLATILHFACLCLTVSRTTSTQLSSPTKVSASLPH